MATTHKVTVENGWNGIITALEQAQAGDTVILAPGQYFGDKTLLINRPLTLQGCAGVELVYSGNESAIHVNETESVSLLDLKISFQTQDYSENPLEPEKSKENDYSVSWQGESYPPTFNETDHLNTSEINYIPQQTNKDKNCITVSLSKNIIVQGNQCLGQGVSRIGITYLSSTGLIENNDCWSNKLSGIALLRDLNSPDQSSNAQLIGNRCHDNKQSGIILFSSTGIIENNECWSNKLTGIALTRGSDSLDQSSDAQLIGNRCHDNNIGIVLSSSTGLIENNDCWSNKLSGISIHRDPDSPDQPSDAQLIDNRCHDNNNAGIALFSSTGLIENNDCWSNKLSGINLQRDTNSPDQPSDAQLTSNRCHDNNGAGIALLSSTGLIENNDCWSNKLTGITLQHNTDSPEQPSNAQLIDNRCHDNNNSGIVLLSSTGLIENNDCWSNKLSGITLQHNTDSPDQPSDAPLTSNRCYDNKQAGIEFISSTGQTKNNECWGNKNNQIEKHYQLYKNGLEGPPSSVPDDPTHKTEPTVTLEKLFETRLNRRNDQSLIRCLQQQNIAQTERLADFLGSGCADCFNTFISAIIQPQEIEITNNPNAETDVRFYKVSQSGTSSEPAEIKSTAIQRISSIKEINQEQNNTTTEALSVSKQRAFYQQEIIELVIENQCSKEGGRTCAVAFVTEETAALDSWVERLKQGYFNRLAREHGKKQGISCNAPLLIDFAAYQQTVKSDSDDSSLDYQALLNVSLLNKQSINNHPDPHTIKNQRALVLGAMPLWGYLGLVFFWALSLSSLCLLLIQVSDYNVWLTLLSDPSFWGILSQKISGLGLNHQTLDLVYGSASFLFSQIQDLGWIAWVKTSLFLLALIVAYCWFNNLLLPHVLHIKPFFDAIVKQRFISEIGTLKALQELLSIHVIESFLDSLERTAWQRWVKLRVFGSRWQAPELIIIVIREARLFSIADKACLHALIGLKGKKQSLLLITHTGGLSHIVNCYLDVCLPDAASSSSFSVDDMFIIHDRDASTLRLEKNDQQADPAINEEEENNDTYLSTIAELLGWPEQSDNIRWQQLLEALIHPMWIDKDILPALVIGSTALTQMTLAKRDLLDLQQYCDELTAELLPYQQLFENQSALSLQQPSVTDTFVFADQAKAILSTVIKRQDHWFTFVLGRSGERKKLATAIMQLHPKQTEAVDYLCRLIACGEVFNLMQLSYFISRKPWPGHRLPNFSELPLYAEAAWVLLKERLALQNKLDLSEPYWRDLQHQFDNGVIESIKHDNNTLTEMETLASRTYCLFLNAADIFELVDDQSYALIAQAISSRLLSFTPIVSPTLRDLFINDIATIVRKLFLLDHHSALTLLDSKFNSDWHYAPEPLKAIIKDQVIKSSSVILQGFINIKDENHLFKIINAVHRPAVIISTLSWLALHYIKAEYSDNKLQEKLLQLAIFINHFKPLLIKTSDRAVSITAPACFNACDAKMVYQLVMNNDFSERLTTVLNKNDVEHAKLRRQITDLPPMHLEGIAWGSHSAANKLIGALADDLHQLNVLA